MVLEIGHISKTYQGGGGTTIDALKDVSFGISAGEMVAVYGPSGSGKSTLLNIVGLLDACDSGEIYLNGESYSGLGSKMRSEYRRTKLGFVFQNFNLLPELNALENVEMSLVLSGLTNEVIRNKSLCMLERVGLLDRASHFPSELSGGQQQRVGIARALVHSPNIILADEPTANLDIDSATLIISIMQELAEETDAAFLFSTHDPRILEIVSKSIYLEEGVQKQ